MRLDGLTKPRFGTARRAGRCRFQPVAEGPSMLIDERTARIGREELHAMIADPAFPCVGAKSALARGTLKELVCHSLVSGWDDVRIHSELLEWVFEYRRDPAGLRSLAVVFDGPEGLSEEAFEIGR